MILDYIIMNHESWSYPSSLHLITFWYFLLKSCTDVRLALQFRRIHPTVAFLEETSAFCPAICSRQADGRPVPRGNGSIWIELAAPASWAGAPPRLCFSPETSKHIHYIETPGLSDFIRKLITFQSLNQNLSGDKVISNAGPLDLCQVDDAAMPSVLGSVRFETTSIKPNKKRLEKPPTIAI